MTSKNIKENNFAVFILTNKRANKVYTVKSLRRSGYKGKIVLVLDDQDPTADEYRNNYPKDEIYVFNKDKAIKKTDTADNTNNPKAVVYARNMCHEIAKELKVDSFLVLDDDYTNFAFVENDNGYLKRPTILNLDNVFRHFIEFLENTPTKSIAFAQGGDFIGGAGSKYATVLSLYRKCMNSFFCKTDRPFEFYGLINEDVNCYTLNASRGDLYFTSSQIQLNQVTTQTNDGGLTTIYKEQGTYVKSFYSVIYHPSSIVVADMGETYKRLHHRVNKDFTYPLILSENLKKS